MSGIPARLVAIILTSNMGGVTASAFSFAPKLIPAGEPSEVKVSSSLADFASETTYTLGYESLGMSPCSVVSASALNCLVTIPSPSVPSVTVQANGTALHTAFLSAYAHPTVTSVSPDVLPFSGGTLVRLHFLTAITTYGSVVVRFADPLTLEYVDTKLSVEAKGLSASGRSLSAPKFKEHVQHSVLLSLNGEAFADTGLTMRYTQKKKLKIGFIYVTLPDDFGWTFQHNVARLGLEEKFFGQIETFYEGDVPEWGPNECDFCHEEAGWDSNKSKWSDEPDDYFGAHRASAITKRWVEDEGVDMIIANSFFFQWDMFHMANRYPHISFIHVTGWLTRDNMAQCFPKVYQARYLSGIATGEYIKKNNLTKKVGYASTYPLGETYRAINAFKLGMEMVDPEIEIYLTWLYTWYDHRKERLGVDRLLTFYGVEAIAQHTDSREPQIVAREHGKVGVGYNTDMLLTVGDSVLTSPVFVWKALYAPLVQKVLDGEKLGGANLWDGADVGAWRLSDFSSKVPVEATLMMNEEYDKLKAGIDGIFCKPGLKDNKGRIRNGPVNFAVDPMPWEANHLIPGTTCLTPPVVNQPCQEYKNGNCVEFWLLDGIYDSCAPSPSKPDGITSLKLPNGECFLGGMSVPDQCPDGQNLTIMGCTNVSAGIFSRDGQVLPCPRGSASPLRGSTSCIPCLPGSIAAGLGQTTCDLCPAGRHAGNPGGVSCEDCRKGQYSGSSGASECSRCEIGTHTVAMGPTTACTPCEGGTTTKFHGAWSVTDCLCPEGKYMTPQTKVCEKCPPGMECPFGSDENYLLQAAKREQPDGAYPKVKKGHMTKPSEPLKAYKCLEPDDCPGGPPGTCSSYRDETSVACAECVKDAYEADGECKECGNVGWWPFLIAIVVAIAGLCVLSVVVNRDLLQKSSAEILSVITVGLLFTGVQFLGVFQNLSVAWDEPIKSILRVLSMLSFDLTILRTQCIVGNNPVDSYISRQLVAPVCCVVVGIAILVKKIQQPLVKVPVEYLNTLGTIFNIFFISVMISVMAPFICYDHPGDNGSSVISTPSMLCFEGGDHSTQIIIAVIALFVIPVPFLALAIYGTVSYRALIAGTRMKSAEQLEAFKFLFFRFNPQGYYYGLVLLLRSLMITLVPVVIRKDPAAQVCAIIFFILVGIVLQLWVKPWRSPVSNLLDGSTCAGFVLLLVAGLGVTPVAVDTAAITGMGTAAFFMFLIVVVAAIAYSLYMRFLPDVKYSSFICHHKADAAAQARLLKLELQSKTSKNVFIDSDDLKELDSLFDTVRCSVKKLVVYSTRDTLTRPWCVGEVTTALAVKLPVVQVITPSFEAPTEEQLNDLGSYIDMTGCNLAEYGMSLDRIREAIVQILSASTPRITLTAQYKGSSRFDGVVAEIAALSPAAAKAQALPKSGGATVVSVDELDDEALAGAGILMKKLHALVTNIGGGGFCCFADYDCEDQKQSHFTSVIDQARAVVVILSVGTLGNPKQLTVMTDAMLVREHAEKKKGNTLPVVPLCTPSFRFPDEKFYKTTLPVFFNSTAERAAPYIQSFFKRIAVQLSTSASDAILEKQLEEVFKCIPKDTKTTWTRGLDLSTTLCPKDSGETSV